MPSDALIIRKEMGYSHKEFLRLLPRALESESYAIEGRQITFVNEKRTVTIDLGIEDERRIALLHIPKTSVTLRLEGFDPKAADMFLQHFNRSYQRGGG